MKKEYWKVIFITIVTIFLTLYLGNLYKHNKEYGYQTNKVVTLQTIDIDTLDNYLLENGNAIIYVVDSKNEKTIKYNNEFIEFLLNKGIQKQISYIDYKNLSEVDIDNFVQKYLSSNIKYSNQDIFVFENGKIIDSFSSSNTKFNVTNIEKYLESHGVIVGD